jgi:hypothetical protein
MFLVSSVAIVLVGLSITNKSPALLYLSLPVFAVAAFVGIQSMIEFERTRKAFNQPDWHLWKYVTGVYVTILVGIVAWALFR